MKIVPYTDIKPTHIDNDKAKGIAAALSLARMTVRTISACGSLRSPRQAILRNTRTTGNMKFSFIPGRVKFTARANGPLSKPVI